MTLIVIRVDASVTIGSGHVVRCRTLARELRRRGAEVKFVCRRQLGDMIEVLAEEFDVLELPHQPLASTESPEGNKLRGGDLYAAWLGCSQRDDAKDTLDNLDRFGVECPSWVIVDHYGLGAEWETEIREKLSGNKGIKLLAIDDLANRRHQVDYLVDQNIVSSAKESRYAELVPDNCPLLLGPKYALLSKEYSILHNITPNRNHLRRVLVYFGGSDSHKLNERALKALMTSELSEIAIDIVIGIQTKEYQAVEELAKKGKNITLHTSLPSLAGLIVRADLAVGASGSTTWERSCLGLPSLVIAIADNQCDIAQALHDIGAIQYLGNAEKIGVEDLRAKLLTAKEGFATVSQVNRLTDGWGAARIAAVVMGVAEPLRCREARDIDGPFLSVSCRKSSEQKGSSKGQNNMEEIKRIVVGDSEGCPIGQMRFVRECSGKPGREDHAVLDLQLDRCAGYEDQVNKMVKLALEKMRSGWQDKHSSLERQKVEENTKRVHFTKGYMDMASQVSPGMGAIGESRFTLLSSKESWLNDHIPRLIKEIWRRGHALRWIHDKKDLVHGDVCLILGFAKVLTAEELGLHKHNLVVHESDLPRGQGWSPMTWQIVGGETRIPVSLFEAEVDVDAGSVYLKRDIYLDGSELVGEWRSRQAEASISLCLDWVDNYRVVVMRGRPQSGTPTVYRRRKPQDSRLDVSRSLKEQFDLLRVVDNERYPAFMDIKGKRYYLRIYR
jgi:UDP-2,4-diacetamido-2,4,6-trideoxy-beta-L-altropyranose hydrolase